MKLLHTNRKHFHAVLNGIRVGLHRHEAHPFGLVTDMLVTHISFIALTVLVSSVKAKPPSPPWYCFSSEFGQCEWSGHSLAAAAWRIAKLANFNDIS